MAKTESENLQELVNLQKKLSDGLQKAAHDGNLGPAQHLKSQIESNLAEIKDRLFPYPFVDVAVNYSQSIEELIKIGDFDLQSDGIDSLSFPSTETGHRDVKIFVVQFKSPVSSDVILTEMNRRQLRPASLTEILYLGMQYPNYPNLVSLIPTQNNLYHANYAVPIIYKFIDEINYNLELCTFEGNWYPHWYFAAVRR